MTTSPEDFPKPPTYSQTKTSNAAWINVTTVKTDSDGTITQSLQIIPKR